MKSAKMRALILCLLPALIDGCFDSSLNCEGDTPRVDPEIYHTMVTANLKSKLDNPKWSPYVDREEFKKYCKSKSVSTLNNIGVFTKATISEMNLKLLPSSFVIKPNKGSGQMIIVRNGQVEKGFQTGSVLQLAGDIMKTVNSWITGNSASEPLYKHLIPKVIVEEFVYPIPDIIGIWVVNHRVDLIQIGKSTKNHTHVNVYDADLNRLPFRKSGHRNFKSSPLVEQLHVPEKLNLLKAIALNLADDLDLDIMRVDLCYFNGNFYGNELTLSPHGGGYHLQRIRPGDQWWVKASAPLSQ